LVGDWSGDARYFRCLDAYTVHGLAYFMWGGGIWLGYADIVVTTEIVEENSAFS